MPPPASERQFKAFVSSTSEDLKDYRAAARLAILDMGWGPEMMEHFGSIARPTVEACLQKLSNCSLMILIVAFRQGWVPTTEDGGDNRDSITAIELKCAREKDIPVLAFLANGDTWPFSRGEDNQPARDWIMQFRKTLNRPAAFFDFEDPAAEESRRLPRFRGQLAVSLSKFNEELKQRERFNEPVGNVERVRTATRMLSKGLCIPFIGAGVCGDGPLSPQYLLRSLGGQSSAGDTSLAAAAEYSEHKALSRLAFLDQLRELLVPAKDPTASPLIYQLLAAVRPPLIVSATVDLLLENELDNTGKTPLILSHVVRSVNSQHDGKIVAFEGPNDPSPTFHTADQIDLSTARDRYVVYKPLGSPLLHRPLPPGSSDFDTVVITEADHLTLLRRLENQVTGIPTAFSTYFQQYPFIFLGYPLDVWHYRLVAKMFQALGLPARGQTNLAIRMPASELEQHAWGWLGTDLLPMDSEQFARATLQV